jgi:hypothetical protein
MGHARVGPEEYRAKQFNKPLSAIRNDRLS